MSAGKTDPYLGKQLGDYRLDELLAVGGMSRVYIGFDQKLERKAAIKILELGQDWVDETIIKRFEREAKSIAALEHPNIVTVYKFDEFDTGYYLAMQYVAGTDLRRAIMQYRDRADEMPPERTLKIARQVAAALDIAHKNGIVHRDIKPSNILLTIDDRALLTDFGLVMRQQAGDPTMGTAFGTPRYIAPEQAIASQDATPQSDIYAFGVILYEMLTGDTPFEGETPMEIALKHINDTPDSPRLRNPNIPVAASDALLKSLSKEPTHRQRSASELVGDLERAYGILGHDTAPSLAPPVTAKPPTLPTSANPIKPARSGIPVAVWGALAAVIVVGIILFVIFGRGSNPAVTLTATDSANNTNNANAIPTADDAPPALLTATAEMVVIYDETTLILYNAGNYPLENTERLTFVRGTLADGGDDFSGDQIANNTLQPGECFRRPLQNVPPLDWEACNGRYTGSFVNNGMELLFWRYEPVGAQTFRVLWDGVDVITCNTVRARGAPRECRFIYPLGPRAQM